MPGSRIKDLLSDFPVLIDLSLKMREKVDDERETEFERKKAELVLKSLRMLANRVVKAELELDSVRSQLVDERCIRNLTKFIEEATKKWSPNGSSPRAFERRL